MSELWHRLECPCNPGFKYSTLTTFGRHFESNRHRFHELRMENRKRIIRLGRFETEQNRLQTFLRETEQQNSELRSMIVCLRTTTRSQIDRLNASLSETRTSETALRDAKEFLKMELEKTRALSIRNTFNQCMKSLLEVFRLRTALKNCYEVITVLSTSATDCVAIRSNRWGA